MAKSDCYLMFSICFDRSAHNSKTEKNCAVNICTYISVCKLFNSVLTNSILYYVTKHYR